MSDASIMIPARDYRLIEKALKKARYPLEDPQIINRVYTAVQKGEEINAQLTAHNGKFYLRWTWISRHGANLKEIVSHDMSHVTFGNLIAHFDIDPSYE